MECAAGRAGRVRRRRPRHPRPAAAGGGPPRDRTSSPAAARRAGAADWPGVAVEPDVDGLLAHADELDLVVVASPTGGTWSTSLAALAAGLPVVVDKPLATTPPSARAAARRAAPGGRSRSSRTGAGTPSSSRCAALLAAGALGRRAPVRAALGAVAPGAEGPVEGERPATPAGCCSTSARTSWTPPSSCSARSRASTPSCARARRRREDDVFLALHARRRRRSATCRRAGSSARPGPRTRVLGDARRLPRDELRGRADAVRGARRRRRGTRRPGEPAHEGWLVHGADGRRAARRPAGTPTSTARCGVAARRGPVPVDPWDAVRTARVLDAARVSAARAGSCSTPGRRRGRLWMTADAPAAGRRLDGGHGRDGACPLTSQTALAAGSGCVRRPGLGRDSGGSPSRSTGRGRPRRAGRRGRRVARRRARRTARRGCAACGTTTCARLVARPSCARAPRAARRGGRRA